jgi:hypothetical protein
MNGNNLETTMRTPRDPDRDNARRVQTRRTFLGCKNIPSLTYNEKPTGLYDDIEIGASRWVEMAADKVTENVRNGGRPFGVVMVQIDDRRNEILMLLVTPAAKRRAPAVCDN